MNRKFFLVIGLFALQAANAVGQAARTDPQITVTGSGEVKVAPDILHLSVGVETRHETLAEAKRQSDDRVAKTLAFIQRSGIAAKDVQTDYVGVEPNYDHAVSRTQPTYFAVRKSIEIRITNLKGFDNFITGILTNGVTTIHGIDFRTSQMRQHRDTARRMAIKAAREKADDLAGELGVKCGKVHNISAHDWSGWTGNYGGYWGRGGGQHYQNSTQSVGGREESSDGTLSLGQISVSASVTVTFLLE